MQNNNTLWTRISLHACLCTMALLGTACATGERGQQVAAAGGERECRTTGSPGTKMRQSICRTVEEWEALDRKTRDAENVQEEFFRRARESGSLGPAPDFPQTTLPGG